MWINPGENCAGCRTDGVDNDGNGYVDDYRGWDFVNGDNNPFDDNGHGTHVAGTIGALGSNGVGVAGVNWQTKIMALKFLDWFGSGTTADAVSAILYAAAKGADVQSNSWGGGGFSQTLANAIATADQAGSLFVAAAGNDGTNNDTTPFYPAALRERERRLGGRHELERPARVVLELRVEDGRPRRARRLGLLDHPRQRYDWFDGTSMATPHVSGVAALVKAADPAATGAGLRALLFATVDPISALAGQVGDGRAAERGQGGQVLTGAPAIARVAATGLPDVGRRGARRACDRHELRAPRRRDGDGDRERRSRLAHAPRRRALHGRPHADADGCPHRAGHGGRRSALEERNACRALRSRTTSPPTARMRGSTRPQAARG